MAAVHFLNFLCLSQRPPKTALGPQRRDLKYSVMSQGT